MCRMAGASRPPSSTAWAPTEAPTVALLIRLSIPGTDAHGGSAPPRAHLRRPVSNNAAVQGVKPEGRVTLRYDIVKGQVCRWHALRTAKARVRLCRPGLRPHAPGCDAEPPHCTADHWRGPARSRSPRPTSWPTRPTRRLRPARSRAHRTRCGMHPRGGMMLGRFWVEGQRGHHCAPRPGGAFLGDMGITSRHFANEACTPAQKDCLAAPSGKSAAARTSPAWEIDDKTLDDVIFYQATLAPPARRNPQDAQVLRGQALFAQAQCATCHRPSYADAGRAVSAPDELGPERPAHLALHRPAAARHGRTAGRWAARLWSQWPPVEDPAVGHGQDRRT